MEQRLLNSVKNSKEFVQQITAEGSKKQEEDRMSNHFIVDLMHGRK